jgi:CHASE2 domain-containing sensor protein
VDRVGSSDSILDFGLARLTSVDSQREGDASRVPGTPGYISPELLVGRMPEPPADIYSFAAVVFEMLTGRPAFSGDAQRKALSQLCESPPAPSTANSQVPEAVDRVLLPALSTDPGLRPHEAREIVAQLAAVALASRQTEWLRVERPRRLIWAAVAALAAIGVILVAERTDLWAAANDRVATTMLLMKPPRPPDPRLLLLTIDETSLDVDPAPLIDRADSFAAVLDGLFEAGARAVGIDILLPGQWAESTAFARAVCSHNRSLVLALASRPDQGFVGAECVSGSVTLVLGEVDAGALFGLVNVEGSAQGVVIRARAAHLTEDGGLMPSFAGRLAAITTGNPTPRADGSGPVWLDLSVSPHDLPRMAWRDVRDTLAHAPGTFRGRVVVIGQDFVGTSDDFAVPGRSGRSGRVSGLELQALITHTLLSGGPVRETSNGAATALLIAAAMVFSGSLFAARRPGLATLTAAAGTMVYLCMTRLVLRASSLLLPVMPVLVALVLASVIFVAFSPRLIRYPRDILRTRS